MMMMTTQPTMMKPMITMIYVNRVSRQMQDLTDFIRKNQIIDLQYVPIQAEKIDKFTQFEIGDEIAVNKVKYVLVKKTSHNDKRGDQWLRRDQPHMWWSKFTKEELISKGATRTQIQIFRDLHMPQDNDVVYLTQSNLHGIIKNKGKDIELSGPDRGTLHVDEYKMKWD